MFNHRHLKEDEKSQGGMVDGRTVSRLASPSGWRDSHSLALDLVNDESIEVKSVHVHRACPLLTLSGVSVLYELEVVTSHGQYFIDRTLQELEELHDLARKLSSSVPKLKKNPLKKISKPKKKDAHIKSIGDTFHVYIEKLPKLAALRRLLSPRAQPKHYLFIDICEGRNLAPRDSNGLSDPYVRISMIDILGKVVGKTVPTSVVPKSLNPVWEEQIVFDLQPSVSAISLSCWDHDRISRDDFMGRITIHLEDIPHNQEIVRWFPVLSSKVHKDLVHGEIQLRILYKHPQPGGLDLSKKMDNEENEQAIEAMREERKQRQKDLEQERFAGKIKISTLYNPPLGRWGGYLTIRVISASRLTPKDRKGTSDPYAVLSLNGKRYRTKKVTHTLEPVWDETFYYHISVGSIEGLAVEVDVYDWDAVGKPNSIGDTSIVIEDLSEGHSDLELSLVGPMPSQQGLDKKLGKRMAEEGWAPHLPIILVPGFGSTSLAVVEGYEKWHGERVWLSLSKISRQAMSIKRLIHSHRKIDMSKSDDSHHSGQHSTTFGAIESEPVSDVDLDAERAFKNRWIQHMCLHENGLHDPEGIKIRPVQGKNAVTYLDPGALTSSLSYVMGPLVENLEQVGYVYGDNLLAAGYDWRLSLHYLEERDGYFSKLKAAIEAMRHRNCSPVVLLGHSMGNRVIQYFLNWIMYNASSPESGRKWIEQNVHTFFAVGAPWLGASKAVRGLASGEKFGMDAFLSDIEAITMGHRISSTSCLLPVGCAKKHHHLPPVIESFVHSNDGSGPKPMPYHEFLAKEAGASRPMQFYEEFLKSNPLYGGNDTEEFILRPPPVERLYAVYGVGLETEIAYVYKKDSHDSRVILEESLPKNIRAQIEAEGYVCKKGAIYETPNTKQGIIQELTGLIGTSCGDGTVSYASLNHCARWRHQIPHLKIEELSGAEHREILANRVFFKFLIEYIADRNTIGNHADLGALAARLRLQADNLLALDEVNDEVEEVKIKNA